MKTFNNKVFKVLEKEGSTTKAPLIQAKFIYPLVITSTDFFNLDERKYCSFLDYLKITLGLIFTKGAKQES